MLLESGDERKGRAVLEILFFWFAGAVLVGVIANSKGRSGIGWFLLAALLSPLLSLIAVVAMPRVKPFEEPTKACPRCAETVKLAAMVCKHCGHEFKDDPFGENLGSYRNLPYTRNPDGTVSLTIEGRTKTWPNVAVFKQEVD